MTGRAASDISPPGEGLQRYWALVAYDGSEYHGFAPNPDVPTVGGTLAQAIGQVVGSPVEITCAGRTDAGVHAWGQVVSFDAPADVDCERLRRSVNRMCGPSVVLREVTPAPDDFDARFSARSRTYRYRVLNREVPDPFLHQLTWHVGQPLDVEAMNAAGRHLVGKHDFASFCRKRKVMVGGVEVEASLVRDVLSVEWRRAGDDLVDLWITATAFCHQMVRAITGTLVEVGLGKRSVDSVAEALAARDRHAAGVLAPPQGLTLWEVAY